MYVTDKFSFLSNLTTMLVYTGTEK